MLDDELSTPQLIMHAPLLASERLVFSSNQKVSSVSPAVSNALTMPMPLQAELRSDRGGLEAGEAPPADGVSSSDLRRQTLEFDIWHTPA